MERYKRRRFLGKIHLHLLAPGYHAPAGPSSQSTQDPHASLRKQVLASLIAAGASQEGIAEAEEDLRDCPLHILEHMQHVATQVKAFQTNDTPALVYADPPPGVDLFHHDIPNTNIRLLYHAMHLPKNGQYDHYRFQWQFYLRTQDQPPQKLTPEPVVELQNPQGKCFELKAFIADALSTLRIDKKHIVRLPDDPSVTATIPMRRFNS
ncbi:hypothetical protein MKEN_00517600 [Mycena kentingensis (nom. inval.)]|nr:hypothetical protein MKEN_00517600 [Mycena kentingensis (nom. inval.)]